MGKKRPARLAKPAKAVASAARPKSRFKGRKIDGKVAVKELASRFKSAKRFGEELREQRVVKQSFLDREVSI